MLSGMTVVARAEVLRPVYCCVALGLARRKVAQYLASGLAIAAILHASFNYLILNYGNIAYSVIFLLVIGFFVLNDFEKLKTMPILGK